MRTWIVSLVCVALLGVATAANAAIIYWGPQNTNGGYNAYTVNQSSLNWDAARVAANAAGPFNFGPGQLATIDSAAKNTFLTTLGPNGSRHIGLTDSTATSSLDSFNLGTLGTAEFGNTSASAYPPAGQTPSNTVGVQRGEGWAWLNKAPLVYQNWNSGEPNNSGGSGENAAEITGSGVWNDNAHGASIGGGNNNEASLVEYQTNFGSPFAAVKGALNFREVKASGTVTSLAAATALVNAPAGDPSITREASGLISTINAGTNGTGTFGGDDTFDVAQYAGGENYAVKMTGLIKIPAAGAWTFGINQDDYASLTIGNQSVSLGCCGQTTTTFNFASAGVFPITAIFGENGGGDFIEISAIQGNNVAFNAGTFQLLGSANGLQLFSTLTAVPEPSTYAIGSLMLLVGVGYAWRMRNAKRAKVAVAA